MNREALAAHLPVPLDIMGGWQTGPVTYPELLKSALQRHSFLAQVPSHDLGRFCSTYSSRKTV